MRNIYKNAMIQFIILNNNEATGAQLVQLYKEVAKNNAQQISQSHVPLNVHLFAKKFGSFNGTTLSQKGRKTSNYIFNF